jgi:hypothetical protein
MSTTSSIHDAVSDAQQEVQPQKEKLNVRSYTIEDSIYFQAKEICENNSINLSKYLRKCCAKLVEDYLPNFKVE